MKNKIKNGAIFALTTLMLVGCSSTSNSPTSTSEVASSTPTPEETETIELTIDNWQDYFEIKEDYSYSYNAFDELVTMSKVYNFYLKDGMTFVEDSAPEIAVEYEYDYDEGYTFTNVDWEKGTFDYSPLDDATKSEIGIESTHKSESTILYRAWDNDTSAYISNFLEITYPMCSINKDNNGETISGMNLSGIEITPKYENFTITRIKGTIEVVK